MGVYGRSLGGSGKCAAFGENRCEDDYFSFAGGADVCAGCDNSLFGGVRFGR